MRQALPITIITFSLREGIRARYTGSGMSDRHRIIPIPGRKPGNFGQTIQNFNVKQESL